MSLFRGQNAFKEYIKYYKSHKRTSYMLFFIKKSTILGVLKTQICYIALNPHMLYYIRGAVERLNV